MGICRDDRYGLLIPTPDGSLEPIKHYNVDEAKKTLGVLDSPSGGSEEHLEKVRMQVETWNNRMKNGHLPSHMAWIAYHLQLTTAVKYGIGTLTNGIEEASKLLHKEDFKTLPILGINQCVLTGWRHLHHAFGGFGLMSLPTENNSYAISISFSNTTTLRQW